MTTIPTTLVTGVDFVTVPTQDLAAAREFYGTVLGLPCSAVYQRGTEAGIGAEFETGNLTLSVLEVAAVGLESARSRFRSRCTSRTSRPRAPSSSRAASRSRRTRSTPASATWTSSRTRTATR